MWKEAKQAHVFIKEDRSLWRKSLPRLHVGVGGLTFGLPCEEGVRSIPFLFSGGHVSLSAQKLGKGDVELIQ